MKQMSLIAHSLYLKFDFGIFWPTFSRLNLKPWLISLVCTDQCMKINKVQDCPLTLFWFFAR